MTFKKLTLSGIWIQILLQRMLNGCNPLFLIAIGPLGRFLKFSCFFLRNNFWEKMNFWHFGVNPLTCPQQNNRKRSPSFTRSPAWRLVRFSDVWKSIPAYSICDDNSKNNTRVNNEQHILVHFFTYASSPRKHFEAEEQWFFINCFILRLKCHLIQTYDSWKTVNCI